MNPNYFINASAPKNTLHQRWEGRQIMNFPFFGQISHNFDLP